MKIYELIEIYSKDFMNINDLEYNKNSIALFSNKADGLTGLINEVKFQIGDSEESNFSFDFIEEKDYNGIGEFVKGIYVYYEKKFQYKIILIEREVR